jgi:hypothetical protein
VARDPFVALEAALQSLHDVVFGDGDDRRRSRRQALADRLEVLVLEALVAELAPDAAAGAADERPGDHARRKDQADDAAGDRAALAPGLAARVRGLLDLDLAVGRVHGDSRANGSRATPSAPTRPPRSWPKPTPHPMRTRRAPRRTRPGPERDRSASAVRC